MNSHKTPKSRRGLWLSLTTLGLMGALVAVPLQSAKQAVVTNSDLAQVTSSFKPGYEDYDIRLDKNAAGKIESFRAASGKNSLTVEAEFGKIIRGGEALRQRIPTLELKLNDDLRNAGLITPDILRGFDTLTGPGAGVKNAETLRNFIKGNNDLFGMNDEQAAQLRVTADYTNPDGNLSFAHLEQFINDVPVFRGEVKAGFTRRGEMFRVINNVAPGLEYNSLSTGFGDPADAVRAAFGHVTRDITPADLQANAAKTSDLKATFGDGQYPTTAEKMYFPTELGVARPAWRVLIWEDVAAFYVIVDAETGTMLYRENITKDQTQGATYNVWANTTSSIKSLDSPAPLTPGPIDPNLGTQGVIQPRTNVTLIGNEAPYTFNNNGWITDGANVTEGNNTIAGLDRANPNGVDAPITGSGTRVFNFATNPAPGNPAPGEEPLPTGQTPTPCAATVPTLNDSQKAAAVQMFYVVNRWHDEMYRFGFTEAAKNFQNDNFGRGGTGNDRVSSEGQDCSGTNNANFATPADGTSGRMQMYIFTNPTPDRDGTIDSEIIIHELTHGTFGRLNAGLGGTQSGQMNEGNSDFFAHAMLSEPSDPINSIYAVGGYATLDWFNSIGTKNYYYGIRRFPRAVLAFTGGPQSRPHNPLTFADIDPAQLNVTNGAFPAAFTGSATAVHDGGEVWSSTLWEFRAKLIQRLGAEAGNRKILQLVTDGLKLNPASPTMLGARNAILQAAAASSVSPNASADVADAWAGFATRGMGFGATNPAGNTVVESFALPNAALADTGFAVADPAPGGDGDGFPEPGETVQLTVPVVNGTGNTVNNVTATVAGGGTANYGNINDGQTVTRQIAYTIPAGAPCGSTVTVSITVSSALGTQPAVTRSFTLGAANIGLTQNFDGVTAPALPAGWTQVATGSNTGWVTSTTTPDSAPNAVFAPDLATPGGADLESPEFTVSSTSARANFRINYNTEPTWDGGILEIKVGSGAYQEITAAGGTFTTGGYNSTVRGTGNPLGETSRPAWSGNSNGYIDSSVTLPASANGQTVRLKWRVGHDNTIGGVGIRVDNVQVINSYTCSTGPTTGPTNSRADFDGDGRTDVSVFRGGQWLVQRSTAGFIGLNWGTTGDQIVPGDYDGDNKTDFAIYRPNSTAGFADFYVINSGSNTYAGIEWGVPGDVARVGDFDGNNRDDYAIYRASANAWYILTNPGSVFVQYNIGAAGQVPVTLDFDGDARTDAAMWNSSNGVWTIRQSSTGTTTNVTWGAAGDKLVPGDFAGNDNRDEIAIFRNGAWFIRRQDGTLLTINWGAAADVPVPGDYDGDGTDDAGVYRNGNWYWQGSTSGAGSAFFGVASDTPVPTGYTAN